MERDIPDYQAARLKQMCGLDPNKDVPKRLADLFWARKFVLDRISGAITDATLAEIAVAGGYGKLTEREANPTVIDLWRLQRIRRGEPVKCKYGDKDRAGKLHTVTFDGKLGVIFDGDISETILNADQVALAAV